MFKKENRIWLYIIGLGIMLFAFAVFSRNFLLPYITSLGGNIRDTLEYNYTELPAFTIDTDSHYRANIVTSKGTFIVDLYPERAPVNVNNFIFLAREGYYEGTSFHRVFADFLIQGGDRNTLNDVPEDDGLGNPGYVVPDEVNWDALDLNEARREELRQAGYVSVTGLESLPLRRNAVAMANAGPNTNGSQFFVVIADRNDPRLELLAGRFTVIGEVVSGANVIQAISQIKVNLDDPNLPRPTQDVIIEEIQITKLSN